MVKPDWRSGDEIEVDQVFRDDGRTVEIVWFPPDADKRIQQLLPEDYEYVPNIDAPIKTNSNGTRVRHAGCYVRRQTN